VAPFPRAAPLVSLASFTELAEKPSGVGHLGADLDASRALLIAAELDGAGHPDLIYFNDVDKGNHFAARQEPDLFTNEVRAAFRSLR
jgi:hypothetical protein